MDFHPRSFFTLLRNALRSLSAFEQLLVVCAGSIVFVFIFSTVFNLSHARTTTWPQYGGTIREGGIGSPRFIHPLYASTDSEKDLVRLTYSGLVRELQDGTMTPDLAESFVISEDKKQYTFTLRENMVFHDGHIIDADDVVYTFTQAQDTTISPEQSAIWKDVDIKKIDDLTVQFTLPEIYADFPEHTTLGIIPEHIWETLSPEEQVFSTTMITPIGSGPFKITSIDTDKDGQPTQINLRRNNQFALGKPYIKTFEYHIFESQEQRSWAWSNFHINTALSSALTDTTMVHNRKEYDMTLHTNRIFGLFVSSLSESAVRNHEVLHALEYLIDKEKLVTTLFSGYAQPHGSMLPPTLADSTAPIYNPEKGLELLTKQGWTLDDTSATMISSSQDSPEHLSFILATGNAPHLIAVAEYIRDAYSQYGIEVVLDIYTSDALTSDIIPERNFDVLLFGMNIPLPTSLEAFWHSRQRKHPGLNITQYTNASTDELLQRARTELDTESRTALYQLFDQSLAEDRPAIALYTSGIKYATRNVTVMLPDFIDAPADRFNHIHQWYMRSSQVWGPTQ